MTSIDINENEIIRKYPDVLEILLRDRTTNKNIFWATNNYHSKEGDGYGFKDHIMIDLISGENNMVIMPRVKKLIHIQEQRTQDMAEVFTPSWICNTQNNLIDEAWFKKKGVFNIEKEQANGTRIWKTTKKVVFPKGKTWLDYITNKRLEVTCGEAPYLTSRYDTTTGLFIPVENRIGLLDRKLRIINENVFDKNEWIKYAKLAYKNIYGFDFQGDNILLARQSLLYSFIDNFKFIFKTQPPIKDVREIAEIISWNIWQMDGLRCVIPHSCEEQYSDKKKLVTLSCGNCRNGKLLLCSGILCKIRDWSMFDNLDGVVVTFRDCLN